MSPRQSSQSQADKNAADLASLLSRVKTLESRSESGATTVTKAFHFYAAHRNPDAGRKCASIHGHRYGLQVSVQHPMVGSVSILFSDLEDKVMSVIGLMDHSLILSSMDKALQTLVESGACDRMYVVPFETSCENLASHICKKLIALGLNVTNLTLQETDTSSVTVSP
jgi:6-pyruvoyl-tetrahydropterin synthase